jgi:diaminobutyrate-2-oxoglutarate transaminase
MSKGLGGIGYPISAILYDKRIESWGPADHIGTFRGNQVSIAAGRGAFAFIKKYNVESHVNEISQYLLAELHAFAEQHEFIGEVRGRGLLIGIEFVKNKKTREPFPEFITELRERCFQRGLLFEVGGHYNNVIRFVPALIVTHEIVRNALHIFKDCNSLLIEKYSVVKTEVI